MHERRPDRLSVLHVLAPLAFGGLESVVRMLAAAQRRRGHDVLVAPLVSDGGARSAWIESVRATGVAVEPLIVPRRRYAAEWRAVSDVLSSRHPSIVHTHGYHGDVVGGLAARRLRLPVVATAHGFLGGDWKQQFYEWLQCRLFRRFDAVIAVSEPMARRLQRSGIPAPRVHVVPNAFDPDSQQAVPRAEARRRLALEDSGFCVGWIGRLSAEKGPDVMLRAIAEPSAAGVALSFIGEGAERRRLEALARRLGVAARVTWHGTRLDAASLVRAFDVIALSSRDEGTPIVLFEAMAACVPVVATSVGGVPHVVSASEALLVPPEDPSALARAIEHVRRDPASAANRAASARRRLVRDFALDRWIARVDTVYAEAIRSRTAAAHR